MLVSLFFRWSLGGKFLFNLVVFFVQSADGSNPEVISLEEITQTLIKATPNGVLSESPQWLGLFYRRQESKFKHILNDFLQTHKSLYQRSKAAYVPGEKDVTKTRTRGFVTLPI